MNKSIVTLGLAALLSLLLMTPVSIGGTIFADNSTSNLVNNTIGNQFYDEVRDDQINLQGVNWNNWASWYMRTAAIKYNQLPSIASDDVTSARLGLYLASLSDAGYGDKTVGIRPAQQSWDTATLTWENNPFGNDNWLDRNTSTIVDTQVINNTAGAPATLGWYWFDVTDVVIDWLDGTATNNGLLIVPSNDSNDESNWTNFFFTPAGETNAPKLEITYVPEPATMGLLSLGALGALLRRRK